MVNAEGFSRGAIYKKTHGDVEKQRSRVALTEQVPVGTVPVPGPLLCWAYFSKTQIPC